MIKVSRRDNCDRYYLLKLFGYGVFVHRLHHSEDADTYHDHPWNWFSIILNLRGYTEERLTYLGRVTQQVRFFNWARAEQYHRIALPNGPVWTVFFHGRRRNSWSVVNQRREVLASEPWRGIGGTTSYRPQCDSLSQTGEPCR